MWSPPYTICTCLSLYIHCSLVQSSAIVLGILTCNSFLTIWSYHCLSNSFFSCMLGKYSTNSWVHFQLVTSLVHRPPPPKLESPHSSLFVTLFSYHIVLVTIIISWYCWQYLIPVSQTKILVWDSNALTHSINICWMNIGCSFWL